MPAQFTFTQGDKATEEGVVADQGRLSGGGEGK